MAKTLEQLTPEELDARERELLSSIETEEPTAPSGLDIREQELVTSLESDGVEVPQGLPFPLPEETPLTAAENDSDVEQFMQIPEFAPEDPSDINFDRLFLQDNPQARFGKSDPIGFIETMRNTRVQEKLPFVGSLYKFNRLANVFEAANNLTKSPEDQVWDVLTPEMHFLPSTRMIPRVQAKDRRPHDIKIIEDWLIELEEKQARGVSIGGKIAAGITELPAFMVEFLLTGPLFKTGSAAAKTAATKLLGRFAEKGTSKLAIRVAGAGFGSLIRTAVNVPRVMAGAVENMTQGISVTDDGAIEFSDDQNPFKSLARSFVDLYIENVTEVSGKALGEGAGKAVEFVGGTLSKRFPILTKFTNELGQKWIANGATKGITRTSADFLKASATKIGYDGILQEMGEEQLGRMLRVATGLEEFDTILPSMEDLLVEAGIFAVPGGISLAATKVFRTDKPTKKPVTNITEVSDQQFDEVMKQGFVPEEIQKESTSSAQAVTVTSKSKALDGNAKTPPIVEPAGAIKRAIVRNIARAEDAVGTWGKTGLKVQKDLREISFRTAVNVGNTTQNIKPLTKGLSKAEKETGAMLIDGAILETGQPHRLVERARLIKVELDIIQNEALSIGLRRGGLTGRAFPQVLTKEGQAFLEEAERDGPKSSKVFAWAQNQVSDGKFKTVDDAIIALQQYREGLISGKTGYIEGTRTLDIGNEFRDWNLDKILSNTIESSWEKIEAGRQWGVLKDLKTDAGQVLLPFKDIQVDMAKIRVDVGNNEANALNEYLKAQYGLSGADTAIVKVARVARTAQFVGKLAFSPLTITRNILDRYAKGLSHGTFFTNARAGIKYPPFLNNWMKSARKIEEQMIRSGAVLGHGHLSEGFTGTEGVLSFIARPFGSSERGNQTYIALVKKLQLESDVKRLMELDGREGVTSKMFDRLATIVGQSQNQTRNRVLTSLTNEQLASAFAEGKVDDATMAEVLHRTTTDSAFPLTLASKRLWWNRRPVLQTATQFKVWSADQTRFIYKDVLKYGVQTGDYSRLARFMVGTWLMGELYNITRDELLNKNESVLSKVKDGTRDEILMAIGKDLVDGGVVGMIADFTYGIGDWAAGP